MAFRAIYCGLLEQCSLISIGIYYRLIKVFFCLLFCLACVSIEGMSSWVQVIFVKNLIIWDFVYAKGLKSPMWSVKIAFILCFEDNFYAIPFFMKISFQSLTIFILNEIIVIIHFIKKDYSKYSNSSALFVIIQRSIILIF